MDLKKNPESELSWRGVLTRDQKIICNLQCSNNPMQIAPALVIERFDCAAYFPLGTLPTLQFYPTGPNSGHFAEWQRFLEYLFNRNKVAVATVACWELLFNPPLEAPVNHMQYAVVSFRRKSSSRSLQSCASSKSLQVRAPNQKKLANNDTANHKYPEARKDGMVTSQHDPGRNENFNTNYGDENPMEPQVVHLVKPEVVCSNFAQTHPSYLETLSQSHASWIFGALAELIDNARDADATRLDISIQQEFLKAVGARIPVLCVSDNGIGMGHEDLIRMITFGHNRPDKDDENVIGRFGIGFKSGSMRLGKDVLVLTQCKDTCSIAFLSRSFNEGKAEVQIPIITYKKVGTWMEFDLKVHSELEANANLKAVKEHSPFNEYSIGQKFASFGENGSGTQIYIYNMEKWGSDYSLQWDGVTNIDGPTKCRKQDIMIRSRRVRSRPGQMSKEVPLDYSLHAYLEVIFLEPRMKMYVQGTRVKTCPLRKSLNKTKIYKDRICGKEVELTLGRSKEERNRGNCGIFLYWHGRLIEAYKRVGGMIHTADMGRGVIGVIDVTGVMRLDNDRVGVLNNKQGFLDCEAYATLEDWLGNKANSYWDENFDDMDLMLKEEDQEYTPDNSWVQCNKCLKWRVLQKGATPDDFPDEWFCYMPPFKGTCSLPEEECKPGVVTVGVSRTYGSNGNTHLSSRKDEMESSVGNSVVTLKELSEASAESDDNMTLADLRRTKRKRFHKSPDQKKRKKTM